MMHERDVVAGGVLPESNSMMCAEAVKDSTERVFHRFRTPGGEERVPFHPA